MASMSRRLIRPDGELGRYLPCGAKHREQLVVDVWVQIQDGRCECAPRVGVCGRGRVRARDAQPAIRLTAPVCRPTKPTTAAEYQAVFDTRAFPWIGADLNDVIDDSPDRTLWVFGDTFVGSVRPDGSVAPGWGFVNNSLVVQSGPCFDFQVAGAGGTPEEWIPSPHPYQYWVGGAVRDRGHDRSGARKGRAHRQRWGVVAFNFFIVGLEIAAPRRSDLSVESITPVPMFQSDVPNTVVPYGGALTAVGGYAYLYGFINLQQMVARVPLNRMTDFTAWQYWRGGVGATVNQSWAWTTDPGQAKPMTLQPFVTGGQPVAPIEVVQYGRGYLAIAKGSDIPDPATPVANTTVYGGRHPTPSGPGHSSDPSPPLHSPATSSATAQNSSTRPGPGCSSPGAETPPSTTSSPTPPSTDRVSPHHRTCPHRNASPRRNADSHHPVLERA